MQYTPINYGRQAMLIELQKIATAAEANGFKVTRLHGCLEIYAPEYVQTHSCWHNGCQYSSADFVISDGCEIGYGYNPFFYGPFHPGFCSDSNFGLKQLLAHPAMSSSLV